MAIKPILFSTEMVRAILDGRKTCTRRLPRKQIEEKYLEYDEWVQAVAVPGCTYLSEKEFYTQYPPYQPGDILYVRETWCKGSWGNEKERYYYKADDNDFYCTWHPSIHMPKEAARIWLKVTDVRVERLQDMTDDDAEAEGCFDYTSTALGFPDVWDSTIKKSDRDRYGWAANPWVWVIQFERCEKPEDA